jgi:hypothetical protein
MAEANLARWVHTGDPADQAAIQAHREELARNRTLTAIGRRPDLSPAPGAMLREPPRPGADRRLTVCLTGVEAAN